MKFKSLLTSGARTSTVFSYISALLGCSFDFGCGIAREQHLQVYSITACSKPSSNSSFYTKNFRFILI